MAKFVHLHVHSEYSLLDGLPKIKKLVSRAKELAMPAVALTDHGTMYGAIEFYKECQEQAIKPIVGIEAYCVNRDHKIKENNKDNHHLLLLAKNRQGYQNLMKLTTVAHLEGYYYRPRFDKETLRQYAEGLICASACPKGELAQLILSGNYSQAKETALWFTQLFGKDGYFLEIQRHQAKDYVNEARQRNPRLAENVLESQKNEDVWTEGIVKLSRELGLPLVATNDVHYLSQSDATAQDALVCISTGKNVTDTDRLRYVDVPTLHFRSGEEMEAIFPDLPDALANTVKIANQVDLKLDLGKWFFPNITIPEEKSAEDYLRMLARKRLEAKSFADQPTAKKRLEYELEVIVSKGYAPYFLMMADMVNWCTDHGIITNTRGSAAGSLVSYVLGVTSVDPLKYALPFERFLNPLRPKPPDIDLDVADNRREELIASIVSKYGQEKVAQVCTFGRMLARAAVRDVGRVLGYPYAYPDKIAKIIPLGSQGFPMTINHALEIAPDLMHLYETDADAKKTLDLAKEIEGNARHASVHAAGVVVSPTAMTDFTPLQLEPNGTKIITQYEMHACEAVGLVKFDILGIRNLSILGAARDLIATTRNTTLDLGNLPLDDHKTFQMLASGGTMGAFQLGGAGMTKWLKELKPNRIEDIMVMIALFRPGPMAIIPEFIARKNGKKPVTYLHPKMAKFLEKSYGLLVYQEDVLFTALEIAGYDWGSVDALRQAIGKKKPKEMAQQHDIFIAGCQKHSGLSKEEAEKIWELFVPFQGYGFNKAHAASYGIVSYQTAYLKAHYPVEFMAALLTAEAGNTDKIAVAVSDCRQMKIVVLPPDISQSDVGFTIENNAASLDGRAIRFGLSAIKNVGQAAIETILSARKAGPFKSLADSIHRVDSQKVNKKTLESLIKAGALDSFGKRAAMLLAMDKILSDVHKTARQNLAGQSGLFDDLGEDHSLHAAIDVPLPDVPESPKEQLLLEEYQFLGFYLSQHPQQEKLAQLADLTTHTLAELGPEEHQDKNVTIGGIIVGIRRVFTKKNNEEMAFVTIQGETGAKIDCVVFPKIFSQNGNRDFWQENTVIVCSGRLDSRDEKLSLVVDRVQKID